MLYRHLYNYYIVDISVSPFFISTHSEQPPPAFSFWSILLLLALSSRSCLLPAASGSQFLCYQESFWPFLACLLGVRLRLVPWLLAVATLLLRLPMAVVPLGLAAVLGPQASRDPPSTGREAPVMAVAVAMRR
jgi:hypothetical protein